MVELTPDSDTIVTPEQFALDLAKAGTSNYLNLNEIWAGQMTDLLGDGVPEPETEVLSGADNDTAQQLEAETEEPSISPYSIVPHPKLP